MTAAAADTIRARHGARSHEAEELRASEERISRLRLAAVLGGFATFWIGYDTGLFPPALALAFAVGFALLAAAAEPNARPASTKDRCSGSRIAGREAAPAATSSAIRLTRTARISTCSDAVRCSSC